MHLDYLRVAPVDPQSPAARECLTAYAAELAERFPEGYLETDLVPPVDLVAPGGALLLVTYAGVSVACGGVRTIEAGIGEVRHMWVRPEFRRIGLGRRLLGDIERVAGELGLHELRLGTHRSLREAIALYRSLGYLETEAYSGTAHTDHWFAKRLQ